MTTSSNFDLGLESIDIERHAIVHQVEREGSRTTRPLRERLWCLSKVIAIPESSI